MTLFQAYKLQDFREYRNCRFALLKKMINERDPDEVRLQKALAMAAASTFHIATAEIISRQGLAKLRLIDFDRVEAKNLGTQVDSNEEVGMRKVAAARNTIFRNVEVEPEAIAKKLTGGNPINLLHNADLVVDAFGNREARGLLFDFCADTEIECLHAGLVTFKDLKASSSRCEVGLPLNSAGESLFSDVSEATDSRIPRLALRRLDALAFEGDL